MYTKVKDSCNCCWKHCDHHKTDSCPNDAIGYDCNNCEHIHWLGDKSLGNGFRLCHDCAGAVMIFLADDICRFMHEISEYVPETMRTLEAVLKDYYLGFIHATNEDKSENDWKSWTSPIRDSRALMEFAGLVLKANGKKMPVELLEEGVQIANKHRDLIEAFADVGESLLKEEIQ